MVEHYRDWIPKILDAPDVLQGFEEYQSYEIELVPRLWLSRIGLVVYGLLAMVLASLGLPGSSLTLVLVVPIFYEILS